MMVQASSSQSYTRGRECAARAAEKLKRARQKKSKKSLSEPRVFR
jgi:hypothetical protein